MVLLAIFAVLVFTTCSASAQNLTAVLTGARLPEGLAYIDSLYDGDDKIYLFGGFGANGESNSALIYSISEDTIQPTANQLPFASFGGAIVMGKNNRIYYLSRYLDSNIPQDIYEYLPDSQSFQNVSVLPNLSGMLANAVPDDREQVFLVGKERDVLSLNLTTLQSERVATLPVFPRSDAAFWVESKQSAYLFQGDQQEGASNIIKFNAATREATELRSTIPRNYDRLATAWDGRFGYVIGGEYGFPSRDRDGILRFDPETENVTFIPVVGFPGSQEPRDMAFSSTTAVYVKKFNRIYMFGGVSLTVSSFPLRDEIWYMSLDPVSPPSTTILPPTSDNPIST